MIIPKIDVFEERRGYVLRWIVDGDCGGEIGELDPPTKMPTTSNAERENWIVYKAAEPFAEPDKDKYEGFTFESLSKARTALRAVRAALRVDAAAQQGVPWPAWAVTAQAAGWKPPRGWKP